MEFRQLMIDILVNVSCKFEMYIFKIAQANNENIHIVFLYVLSIHTDGQAKTNMSPLFQSWGHKNSRLMAVII